MRDTLRTEEDDFELSESERTKLTLIAILFFVVGLLLCFIGYYGDVSFLDLGGCASLVVTLSILIYLAIPLRLYHNINQLRDSDKPLWAVVILILTLVGSIGVWLSVRVIGLNVWHLLFVEKFAYSVTNIFDVITFILATNVCFTLSRTFLKVASSSNKEKKEKSKEDKNVIEELFNVVMQTIVIGFIALLPRSIYRATDLGDFNNFVMLLVFMIAALVVMLFARSALWKRKNSSINKTI